MMVLLSDTESTSQLTPVVEEEQDSCVLLGLPQLWLNWYFACYKTIFLVLSLPRMILFSNELLDTTGIIVHLTNFS